MSRLDLIVFGATGFTGQQAAAYLFEHAPEGLTWGIAAMNSKRLAEVADRVGNPPQFVADISDPASIAEIAAAARVLITTVGPYTLYGDVVVDACVEAGTHYADITGETPWVRRVIDRHHDAAVSAGIALIPFSGFDSVPSDLGVWWLVRKLQEQGLQIKSVRSMFSAKGGVNGGTLASARAIQSHFPRKELANPFLLCSDYASRDWHGHRDPRTAEWDETLSRWRVPFFMGPINTRVVRRSIELYSNSELPYTDGITYQEWMNGGHSKLAASTTLAGLGVLNGVLTSATGGRLVKWLGPSPGQGPSESAMDNGFVKVRYVAETDQGERVAMLTSNGDPGNRVTLRCLCETGISLALDGPLAPGVVTPAFGLGERLSTRLENTGKWSFTLVESA